MNRLLLSVLCFLSSVICHAQTAGVGGVLANKTTGVLTGNTYTPATFASVNNLQTADGLITWARVIKTGSSLADLATRSASDLSSGTLPDSRFPTTLPALNGSLLTAINATQLTSGTVPVARLPQATTSAIGAVEISTSAEAIAGTDTDRAVTPESLHAYAAPLQGDLSRLMRMASDAFEIQTNPTGTRKFSILVVGDSLGARVAGFLAGAWVQNFVNENYGVALNNTGELWSGGTVAPIGQALSPTAPAVRRGIETADANYSYWPSGAFYEIPATGIVKATGGNGYYTFAQLKVYYIKEVGAGTIDVQTSPDNATWTTVATIDANAALAGAVSTTAVTRGKYYVRLLGVTGTVRVVGIGLLGGTAAGYIGSGITQAGLSLSDAASTPASILQPIIADINPSVITIHFDDLAETFASSFSTFKSHVGADNATWLVIGNGPKSGAGGDANSKGQCDWLRENAFSLGFVFFDGMRASGSWAQLNALGLGGDGVHLAPAVYSTWASAILDHVSTLTAAFDLRNKGTNQRATTLYQLTFSDNEIYQNPAAAAQSAGKFIPNDAGYTLDYRMNRGFALRDSTGASIVARFVTFEGNLYGILPPRSYMANMSGALPSTYTTPSTGGVAYVTGNEFKWRNAANAIVYDMVLTGAGSPEGVVTAVVGKLYTRTDGGATSTLYVKESGTGNTGWVAK